MTWYPGKFIEELRRKNQQPLKIEGEEIPDVKPEKGKEEYYLRFNKDEIFKNLIAAEGHFRNVFDKKRKKQEYQMAINAERIKEGMSPVSEELEELGQGFLNCVVKHLADSEGHSDEAISHSAVVEGEESSCMFRELRDDTKTFRWKVQKGVVTPFEGIKQVRQLRRTFESFNPEYDISKCKSCEPVNILMKKALQQQKECVDDDKT